MAAMKILTPEKQKEIISNVFGKAPEVAPEVEKTPVEAATDTAKTSWKGLFDLKRKELEEQKTSNAKLARYNALGNVLTSMVQPLGWAIGGGGSGVTGGVQKYDDRQYLEAFNRAVKASDELKNLGSAEAEYQFKIDEEARQRAIAEEQYQRRRAEGLEDYETKANIQGQIQSNYAAQRYQEEMDKIKARGETQLDIAKYKATHKVTGKSGVPVEDKMLSSAWTKYMQEREKFNTDVDRGVVRKRESFPSFEEWLGEEYGWVVKEKGKASAPSFTQSSRKPNPMGGETKAEGGKKKNPMN